MPWMWSRLDGGVSPAISSVAVRDRTPSTRAVTVFVTAGPWVTVATPSLPVVLAYPLAASTAPPSLAIERYRPPPY